MAPVNNILLVYPEVPRQTYWSFRYALKFIRKKASMPPLGLITVAALIPPSYAVKLVDMNIEKLEDHHLAWADVVFLSGMIVQKASFENVVAACHRHGKPIVAGGPYATSCFDAIKGVDHFVVGEAEELIGPLLEDLQHGSAKKVYRCLRRPDLTTTAMPRFDLLQMDAYADMAIQYSRGCPFKCEFCDIWPVYGTQPRLKSAAGLIKELDSLHRLGWKHSVFIVDDNFIGNKQRVKRELLPALQRWQRSRGYPFRFFTEASINMAEDNDLLAGMRDAGFNEVFIGIESPSPASLEESGKKQNLRVDMEEAVRKIQRCGLGVMAGFILGFDNDTDEIFDQQISFIQKTGIPKAMVGLLNALPGTTLHRRLCREGRLLRESAGNNTHELTTNFVTRMSGRKLQEGYRHILETIYDRNLKNYFARCNTLLDKIGPSDYFQRRIRFEEVRTFLASLARQPFTPYGMQYLKFLARSYVKHRKTFAEAVTFGVIGHHIHTITQEVLKREKVALALEEAYNSLQNQMNEYTRNVRNSSRDALRTATDLWNQRSRILADARKKIDKIPADFRSDLLAHYEQIARKMAAMLDQLEHDLAQYNAALFDNHETAITGRKSTPSPS